MLLEFMNFDTLIDFFKWCSIINGTIIIISVVIFSFFSDFSYKNNKKLFAGDKKQFNQTIYTILLCYKMIVLVFNVVPYFVLLIINYV
jgi:L-cystine uptake protein TcyP (sodium:dicarboxylate symporter family)